MHLSHCVAYWGSFLPYTEMNTSASGVNPRKSWKYYVKFPISPSENIFHLLIKIVSISLRVSTGKVDSDQFWRFSRKAWISSLTVALLDWIIFICFATTSKVRCVCEKIAWSSVVPNLRSWHFFNVSNFEFHRTWLYLGTAPSVTRSSTFASAFATFSSERNTSAMTRFKICATQPQLVILANSRSKNLSDFCMLAALSARAPMIIASFSVNSWTVLLVMDSILSADLSLQSTLDQKYTLDLAETIKQIWCTPDILFVQPSNIIVQNFPRRNSTIWVLQLAANLLAWSVICCREYDPASEPHPKISSSTILNGRPWLEAQMAIVTWSRFDRVGNLEADVLRTQKLEIFGILEQLGPSTATISGCMFDKCRLRKVKRSFKLLNTISVWHTLQIILLWEILLTKWSITAGILFNFSRE